MKKEDSLCGSRELEFAIFCIENVASKLHVDAQKVYVALAEQAEKWCSKFKRRGKDGIVSRYVFDENAYEELKTLIFDAYSEDWLDYILNCRRGQDSTDYDLVVGGVANDNFQGSEKL